MARVADFIEQHRDLIVERYVEEVSKLPTVRGLRGGELINTLPEYLSTLVAISRGEQWKGPELTKQRLEETHLSLRLRLGVTEEDTTAEYALLGGIISGLWADVPDEQRPPPEDLQRFGEELQRAMDHVTVIYSGYTVEDRQAEKRSLRRIEVLASELLSEAARPVPLGERLKPLVEVVQDATGAEGAALLLSDEERRSLLPLVSTGRWSHLDEREPTPLDSPSYVARIAASDEPVYLSDAACPTVDVSEGVRRSGLHSLLGCRLCPHGKLLGVLYIGVSQVRPFEPRLRRYLEMLVEHLSSIIARALLLQQLRESNERLRESEARYRLATLAISDALWEWSLDTGAFVWSEGAQALLGYGQEALARGLALRQENLHPEDRARVLGSLQVVLEGQGERWEAEYRFRTRWGEYLHVTDHAFIQRDAAGRPVRMVGAMRNITERKRAEEALRAAQQRLARSEAMLRTVIDSLPVGVWVADETGRLLFGNEASRRIWAGERLVGSVDQYDEYQGWWLDTGQRLRSGDWSLARALSKGEQSLGEIVRIRTFDGTEKILRVSATPLRDAGGHIFGAVAVNEDVTRLTRMEAALRKSEQEFRTLAESMPQIVWTARADGVLDYVNQQLARLIGKSFEGALESMWHDIIHPEDLPLTLQRWTHSLETHEPYQVAHRIWSAEDSYRWFLSRATTMQDEEGRVLRWFGTSTDIEDLKRAEAELRKRAQFEQQLIGIVSHDLRNPLNAILLSVITLLRRKNLDERQRTALLRIQAAAERASRLIRDLLDFTQARLSGIPLQRGPLDLHEFTGQVLDEVRLAHPERSLERMCRGDGRGEWDPDRVAQVITNLLSNALHYSPEGSVIRVQTRGEQDAVALQVHNEGPPIPAEFLPRLFEPLERGNRTDRRGRSIGLGLFIVKSIVVAHGGTVSVHSAQGEGTTFTVRLPRHTPAAPRGAS